MKDDPLEALLVWPLDVREKVRDVLLPLCWINAQHEVTWKNAVSDKELLSARRELILGVLYELDLADEGQISPERALQLVDIIRAY